MSELTDKLAAYGVDIPTTMDRFVDDEELYESCLYLFLEDENFEQFKETIKNKEYEKAFEHAHALKGVVGNLGLAPLTECICEVVEMLRAGNYEGIDEKAEVVFERLEEFKKILNKS